MAAITPTEAIQPKPTSATIPIIQPFIEASFEK
jgi:hypothetical protein